MLPFPVYDVYINKPNWLQKLFRVNNWVYRFTSEYYPDYINTWNTEGKAIREQVTFKRDVGSNDNVVFYIYAEKNTVFYVNDTRFIGKGEERIVITSYQDIVIAAVRDIVGIEIVSGPVTVNINDLKPFKKLKYLYLEKVNAVGDIKTLAMLPELVHIDLQDTEVHGTVDHLSPLEHLTVLDIRDTNINGNAETLYKMEKLDLVALTGSQVINIKEKRI